MKILDAALLSTAIGLTCSTLFLFASDYPEGYVPTVLPPPLETSVPRSKEFLAIVVHGASDDCRKSDPGSRDSRAHFVVPVEDERGAVRIESTPRWREQLAAAHTRNLVVNRRSIAVWVEIPTPGSDPSPAQKAALADLITRLRAQYGIPGSRVFAHADVDVQTSCGSGVVPELAKK
ncbi:MAG TPA: peptidoglycan recognition family protein [Planctomycetota bacterium]|nr:peptidoglycan recognition family protein [Planctomycetota bacterium]